MTHVMLDLETMGTAPNAAILAIGAVKFDPAHHHIEEDSFYRLIDLGSSVGAGLVMDVDTVLWWLGQSAKARAELTRESGRVHIRQALQDFSEWYGEERFPVWGDGAASDNVWMKSAFEAVGLSCPWTYKEDRCFRTMKELRPTVDVEFKGAEHRALDDAIYQAERLMAILDTLPKDHGLH